MALTALATVRGGTKPGTQEKRKTLKAGSEVPKGYFTTEELEHYKSIGVLGEPTTVQQSEEQSAAAIADRDKQIAELKAALAAAQESKSGEGSSSGGLTPTPTPSGSGVTATKPPPGSTGSQSSKS